MSVVELDVEEILEATEAASPQVEERLAKSGVEIPSPGEDEGGAVSLVPGVTAVNQLDPNLPWDGNFNNAANNCGPSCL